MILNKDTMVTELRTAIPDFIIDPDWVPEKLGYLIFSDLARYLCETAQLSDWKTLKQGLNFLERSLEGRDSYMKDLVHEALEALLSCEQVGEMKHFFGAQTRDLWNEFIEPTFQKGVRDKDLR